MNGKHSDNIEDQPWLANPQWSSPTIYSTSKSLSLRSGSVTFVIFLICIPLTFLLTGAFSLQFSLFFWIPAAIITAFMVRKQIVWKAFKKVPITLSPFPGVAGGKVAGSIIIPKYFDSKDEYTCELRCTERWEEDYYDSSNRQRTRRVSSEIWSKTISPQKSGTSKGTKLEFSFETPSNSPESSKQIDTRSHYHDWVLEIRSNLNNHINFNRSYEIPVFITSESRRVEDDLKDTYEKLNQRPVETTLEAVHGEVKVNTSKNNYEYKTVGDPSVGGLIAFGGICSIALGVFMNTYIGSNESVIAAYAIGLLFIGAGSAVAGLNKRYRVEPNKIEFTSLFIKWTLKKRIYRHSDIEEIKVSKDRYRGQDLDKANYYVSFKVASKTHDISKGHDHIEDAVKLEKEISAIFAIKGSS